jgi:hypothetical protein
VSPPLAHETWFEHGDYATDWSFAGEGLSIALLAGALAVTALVRLIARVWPGIDVRFLGALTPWMPFALRMHLAVSLISLLSLGVYLSPAMDLDFDLVGVALGAVMVLTAVGMATGFQSKAAAWLLIAAGPVGMLEFGFWDVLQRIDLLGVAVFVLLAGPGRWSADVETRREREPTLEGTEQALWALRVSAGVALIVVAFVEKLATPDLALAFLDERPQFNVAREIGLPMGDLEFIRLAGSIEVLFGLLLISGALPQAVVLIAGVPFNATLFFFGETELAGHLPVYGTMLALLVYGSDPRHRPLVSSLWPWRRRRQFSATVLTASPP